jgi:hypothetical protein
MDGDNLSHSPESSDLGKAKPEGLVSPEATTQSAPQPVTSSLSTPRPYAIDEPSAEFQFAKVEPIAWSASEFIAHQKSPVWYITLAAVAIIVAAFIFFVTGGDVISTGVILFVAVVLGFAAARKPRTLPYRLDGEGLTVNTKFYDYSQFRSFAVVDDGAFSSIVFMPLKRFMSLLEVYYEPKDEEKIVNLLSERLPLETHKLDPVDQLMRHIRF